MLISLLVKLVDAYSLLVVIYVILSWFPTKSGVLSDIDRALGKLCDPYLNLFRRFIPPIGGMVDISPIIALLALQLVMRVLYMLF